MSVPKRKQKESKVEFDNTYFKIYDDAVRLIENKFGANAEQEELFSIYIEENSREILRTIFEIGKLIRLANSTFPTNELEHNHRRLWQDRAIGLCFDLLTKYQMIMHTIGTKDNKYVSEIKNIYHEINCIKNWRNSDTKRFKLG